MRFIAVLLLLVLTACASVPSDSSHTPAQKVYAAHKAYDAALSLALAYMALPECGKGHAICHEPSVILTLRKADAVAYEALTAAQTVVRSTSSSASSVQAAIIWATEAIGAFKRVTDSLKLSTTGGKDLWVHLHSPHNYSAHYPPSFRLVLLFPTLSTPARTSFSNSRTSAVTPQLPSGTS